MRQPRAASAPARGSAPSPGARAAPGQPAASASERLRLADPVVAGRPAEEALEIGVDPGDLGLGPGGDLVHMVDAEAVEQRLELRADPLDPLQIVRRRPRAARRASAACSGQPPPRPARPPPGRPRTTSGAARPGSADIGAASAARRLRSTSAGSGSATSALGHLGSRHRRARAAPEEVLRHRLGRPGRLRLDGLGRRPAARGASAAVGAAGPGHAQLADRRAAEHPARRRPPAPRRRGTRRSRAAPCRCPPTCRRSWCPPPCPSPGASGPRSGPPVFVSRHLYHCLPLRSSGSVRAELPLHVGRRAFLLASARAPARPSRRERSAP